MHANNDANVMLWVWRFPCHCQNVRKNPRLHPRVREEHGFPPTIGEIGRAVGISSTSVVKYNLERLEEKGKLERSDEISRGLRLKDGVPMVEEAAPRHACGSSPVGLIPRADPGRGTTRKSFRGDTLVLPEDLVRQAATSTPSRSKAIR